uniref:Uncharacterized protein n=1 Tax=viral metagenome TaxID=1070528 RepID=A0A6C0JNH3_9ZZZZ
MFWKTFLISFMLNSKKHTTLVFLDSKNTHLTLQDSIPKKQRKSFDEEDNILINNQKKGYDNRYNFSEKTNEMFNITKFNTQLKLLKQLENKNINEVIKRDLIDEYNKKYSTTPAYNVLAGGLYNDWNFEI